MKSIISTTILSSIALHADARRTPDGVQACHERVFEGIGELFRTNEHALSVEAFNYIQNSPPALVKPVNFTPVDNYVNSRFNNDLTPPVVPAPPAAIVGQATVNKSELPVLFSIFQESEHLHARCEKGRKLTPQNPTFSPQTLVLPHCESDLLVFTEASFNAEMGYNGVPVDPGYIRAKDLYDFGQDIAEYGWLNMMTYNINDKCGYFGYEMKCLYVEPVVAPVGEESPYGFDFEEGGCGQASACVIL